MFDKRNFKPKSGYFAIRLDLIGKVNGIEEAESYFDTIPEDLRTEGCYSSLLNCYVRVRDVDKAESIMQKMRHLGFARSSLSRSCLLNLYYQTQNHEKLENLVREMQEDGIKFSNYTFGTLINAYAATSNREGIDKLLAQLEDDPIRSLHLDWSLYAIAANGYMKLGLFDKAFNLLKKSEELITYKKWKTALTFLMTQYAAIGKKEEAMRLWSLYKKDGKLYSNGYLAIISSVLKFDDFETAENIFEEWESRKLGFDVRILNLMIGAYSRKGNVEAAEAALEWTIMNGGKPNSRTWSYLSSGYLQQSKFSMAVECIKEAISICELGSRWWTPFQDSLAAIFESLKDKGDVEGAEELVRLLRSKDLLSLDVHNKLMNWIKDVESNVHAIDVLGGDSHKQTSEVSEPVKDRSNNGFCLPDQS